MNQTIDPVKLKAAAEHLEWVLKQYPDNDDVQSLLHALTPLIEDAKAERISTPMDGMDVPGAFHHGEGAYIPYKHPDVGDAYARFVVELEGGLTQSDKQRLARIENMLKAAREG